MRVLSGLLTTTILMAYSVSAAAAAGTVPNLTGRWSGYFRSFGTGVGGALSIQISSQDERRFGGEVCFPASPCTPVMGTIAASGEITLTGRTSEVQNIEMHGTPFDQLTGVFSTVIGEYHITRATGAIDQGNVVIVHQASEDGLPADVGGDWGGQATPRGSAAARPVGVILQVDGTGAITGKLGWATPDARSEIVGQGMRVSGADEIAIVGRLDDALLAGTLVPSGSVGQSRRLDGMYERIVNGGHPQELGHLWLIFNKFGAAAAQSEARSNLKALFTAEKAFLQEHDVYSTFVGDIGFSPERNNRYRYVLTANPISLEDRSGVVPVSSKTDEGIDADLFRYPLLVYPKITAGPCIGALVWGITQENLTAVFTGAAYGNVDTDSTLDIWTISTANRLLSGTPCDAVGTVPAGEPANEQNDIIK